jgi:hypothetical protein
MGDDLERVADNDELEGVSMQEIEAEGATALPDKEVMSLLNIDANVDLGLDLAAPVDLAVAANLNVAAPIEAAAAANVLSANAEAAAVAQQAGTIDQTISGSAEATAPQNAQIDQTDDGQAPTVPDGEAPALPDMPDGDTGVDVGVPPVPTNPVDGAVDNLLENGSLLDADVNINADADITAPINGAVAANANVAAPINAAVGANIGSDGAVAQALADQQVNINQSLDDVSAEATAEQNADIDQ